MSELASESSSTGRPRAAGPSPRGAVGRELASESSSTGKLARESTRGEELEIYDPCAEPTGPAAGSGRRLPARRPAGVLGILDNGKPNFNNLMTELRTALSRTHRVGELVYRTKASQSHPAPAEWLGELAERCALVITGSGD